MAQNENGKDGERPDIPEDLQPQKVFVESLESSWSAKDKGDPLSFMTASWYPSYHGNTDPSFHGNTEATEPMSENPPHASNPLTRELIEAQMLENQAAFLMQAAQLKRMEAVASNQPVGGQPYPAVAEPWMMQQPMMPPMPPHMMSPMMQPCGTPPEGQERPKPDTKKEDVDQEPGETVQLANIPNNYKRNMLVDLLNARGFKGKYDFLYLPIDFKKDANLGYAFINFVSIDEAKVFKEQFQGFSEWNTKLSGKVADVKWGKLKGLQNHIDRYQNSPVMHHEVDESQRPMLFKDGEEIPFPPPTKKIKAPWKKTRGQPAH